MIPAGLATLYSSWRTAYEPRYQFLDTMNYYNSLSSKIDTALGRGLIYDEATDEFREPTKEEKSAAGMDLLAFYRGVDAAERLTFKVRLFNQENGSPIGDTVEYTPIGIYEADSDYTLRLYIGAAEADAYWQTQRILLSYLFETSTNYVAPEGAIYENAFVVYDNTNNALTDALTKLYTDRGVYDENDVSYALSSTMAQNFNLVDSMVSNQ